ncbi:Gfo/Idh/MocA family oxidoreductase [Paenibacillus sp. J5C_2022]|uniref:Gfo/Idh/MocA family protein n=1 Tax=Paenibacillus sp. J5C2022 TaxID=2977129 RepID=UPI0021D07AFF|nr:Gfo/Idh/MocA family oxidoreductase [Paenibacillus sp. J5C2022]MCU6711618.1 Gfo/Idh/MocA family oxidoreductase [Paenibacillus sp. J5C2022]
MENPVKYAIVGCGIIADIHAAGIAAVEEAELIAVYDTDEEKGRAFANKYGAAYYTSYEALLADNQVEVVNICTPSALHPDQTILAAQAGKHVICEKPIAIQLKDARRMIAACHEYGVKLTTVFPRRMSPAAQFLKAFLAGGGLGKLTLCNAFVKIYRSQQYYDSAGWRGTWEMDGGGAMMNQGIHTIDLLQWLVGEVKTVYGRAEAKQRRIEVEDTAIALLQYENDAMGVLEVTTTADPDQGQRIEIHGERGTAIYTEDQITLLHADGEPVQLPTFEPFQVLPDGHRMQIRDMALSIREDRSPNVTGEDGVHALEIILGTYTSSNQRQEIELASLR